MATNADGLAVCRDNNNQSEPMARVLISTPQHLHHNLTYFRFGARLNVQGDRTGPFNIQHPSA